MSDQERFIVISNSRCGSTFLATALGRLEDVCVDYEIKIPPINYDLQKHHVLATNDFNDAFWHQLKGLKHCNTYGTKCVLDPVPPSEKLSKNLGSIISPNTKYIFLKRSIIEQIISQYKTGMIHKKSDLQILESSSLEQAVASSHDHDINAQVNFIEVVKRRFIDEALSRIETDEMIKRTLDSSGVNYIELDYQDISSSWNLVKTFLGSKDESSIESCTITNVVNISKTSEEKQLINLYRSFDTFRDDLLQLHSEKFAQHTVTSTSHRRITLKSLIILFLKKLYFARPA